MSNFLKILNFIKDEKFIDLVIENHDLVKDDVKHHYVIIIPSSVTKDLFSFSYIKNYHRVDVIYENEILDFITINGINAVIIHSLISIPINVLPLINNSIPILWSAWGSDIYQHPYAIPYVPIKNLYSQFTKDLLIDIRKREKGNFKYMLRAIKRKLIQIHIYTPTIIKDYYTSLKRINFFSGVIDIEYDLMSRVKNFNATESVYAYRPLIYEIGSSRCNGNNILLGNSGNPTNNHIDILHILKNREIKGVKIVTPLSYGGEDPYIEMVMKTGIELYGDEFHSLTSFLPKHEYINYINSCGNIIIGTMRQQAMGNITMGIAMGCKLFFYKDSVLYKYFKNKGFIVFSIEEDLLNEAINSPLSENEIKQNIELLKKSRSESWNPEILKRLYSQFREYIDNYKNE